MRNRTLAARITAVAAAVGCVGVLSGCHEILRVTLGNPDPPVHDPNAAGRAAPAAREAAASGRAFRGHADGKLASKVTLKHGFVMSRIGPARFVGQFTGTLPGVPQAGDELLAPFTSSAWHGRFAAILDRRNKRIKMSGLILADYTNATSGEPVPGRACLRMAYKNKRKGRRYIRNRGRSTVTVLGGEGDATTLVGSAVVQLRQTTGDNFSMSGHVKVRRGSARGFNAACTKLERQFALASLTR